MRLYIFPIIILVILSLLYGMLYFSVKQLSLLLQFPYNSWYKWLYVGYMLLIPIAMLLGRTWWNEISRFLFVTVNSSLVIVLYSFLVVFLFFLLNKLFLFSPSINRFLIPLFIIGITLYSLINGITLRTRLVKIPFSQLKESIRIAQITDLHLGSIFKTKYLSHIVDEINKQKHDLVVITGDFIDDVGITTVDDLKSLERIAVPIYYITGNHEMYGDIKKILYTIAQTKAIILHNQVAYFKGIPIVGIDDIGHQPKDNLSSIFKKIPINDSLFTLLLSHQPINWKYSKNIHFNLQLAGHTHGGQLFPFTFIVPLFFPEYKGLYQQDNQYIYVSQGAGSWGPPLRLGTKNELTIIQLDPK